MCNRAGTSTTKSLVGHRLRSSKSKGSELSDKELARRRLKAYNEQQDKKRRQDREAMLEKKKAKEEQRQQRMLEEMGKAPPSASVGAWSTDLPDVPLKPTSTRGSARRHPPKNSPMRINVPDESPTNNRYDCVVDTPTTPAAAESIEAAELAVALNAPMMPEPEREPESSSSLPPVLKTNSIDLDDMKRFDTDLNAILAEHTISQAEMTACEAAFMKADRNGDGAIQQSEFRHLLSELGIGVSLQQLRAYSDSFFSKQDKDGSGAVDLDEFQKFYHRCLASEKIRRKYIEHVQHRLSNDHMSEAVRKERALSAFLAYDADQSNVIEKKELSSILRDLLPIKLSSSQWRLLINELLARGDKDHSGGLDFDEFFDLYSKCLASSMVTEHFSDKVVMRFDKGGQWYLEAVADEGATTDQKEAALARFIAEEQKPTKAANASHESAAAAHIQARQRGKLARQKQQMQHDAAVTLQKVVRGRQTRGQRLGMLVPLDGDPPKELVEVFNKLDTDDDGYLKHADIVRLDKICGRPVVLDYAGWLSLCEMVSCRNPKAGLTLNDMWQYYAQAGDDELMQARSALFAQDTKEQTRSVTQIQAAVRGKRGRKQAAERKSEAIQERAAATKIQAHHRGKTGRKSAEQKKEKESSAATKVQAMQRGRATRRTIATKQADEIRAMDERAKQFAEEAEQKRQAAGQPDTTDSAALAEQKKQADAAAKIQSRARGKQTRKTLHERRKAAIALQSRQRGRAARSKYAGRHKATTEQREEQGQKQQPATTPPETEPAPPKPVHPEPPPAPANPDAKDMVAAIFAHYDTDQDGWLQHADVSRLEKETGDGGAVDPDSWAGLCEILGADKKKVRNWLVLPCALSWACHLPHLVLTPHSSTRVGRGSR